MLFVVASGVYEGLEDNPTVNCNYLESFADLEKAFSAYKSKSESDWRALYRGKDLVVGFNPLITE